MLSIKLLSPAKLNLFLHINGKRPDGYHELQTLFQLLDYGDPCEFELRTDGELQLFCNMELAPEENLAYRAGMLLKEKTGSSFGANIKINKQIPSGAGLGGGSSNAASTLVALNSLWKTKLSTHHLIELGRSLGADVPVFIAGQTAWAEGIGEQLTPLELPEQWYLVIKPNCHVSTRNIFSSSQLTRDTPRIKVATFFGQGGKNDCQTVVLEQYPEVKRAFDWLSLSNKAQLTGTGSCIFACFNSAEEAQIMLDKAKPHWECFMSKGVNQSDIAYL